MVLCGVVLGQACRPLALVCATGVAQMHPGPHVTNQNSLATKLPCLVRSAIGSLSKKYVAHFAGRQGLADPSGNFPQHYRCHTLVFELSPTRKGHAIVLAQDFKTRPTNRWGVPLQKWSNPPTKRGTQFPLLLNHNHQTTKPY